MEYLKRDTKAERRTFPPPALLAVLACLFFIAACGRPAMAGKPRQDLGYNKITPDPGVPLSYDDCVRLALHQSPLFIQTGMEIELKRLDEADSFYDYFPDLYLSTTATVIDPKGRNENPYSLSIDTGDYNPILAHFGVKAQRLMTQLAILAHLKVISNGLHELGKAYLDLAALERAATYQDELVALAEHNAEYVDNLIAAGSATPLQGRIAMQEVELAKLEREEIAAARDTAQDKLKTLLGMQSGQRLTLDLENADLQVLSGFDPVAASLENARDNSIELKVEEHKRELQKLKVYLAYADYMPEITAGMKLNDDTSNDRSGYYVTVGFRTPLWDWGERFRNITRQRNIYTQYTAEKNLTRYNFDTEYRSLKAETLSTATAYKIAKARSELAGLRKRQAEISYHAGTVSFPEYLAAIKEYFAAQKDVLYQELDYDKALFALRHFTGDLYTSYVDAAMY